MSMPDGHFEKLLLDHIRHGRNDEAKAMLNEELARAFDDSNYHETLLHHAAAFNNAVIAQKLIELGADVDRIEGRNRSFTPLMTAMASHSEAVVQVLVEAGARIDIVNRDGKSALRLALNWILYDPEILKLLICKLKTGASTNEELAETLIRTGCDMRHATMLRDIDLMRCMLDRGVDVNSTTFGALHVAIKLEDINLADWLLNEGADVDATDTLGRSALEISVERGNKAMVEFLLERGACPDGKGEIRDFVPLKIAFARLDEGAEEFFECAELLLQHGASLRNSEDLLEMFHFALNYSCDKAVKSLIARLAMLEMLGEPVDKLVMRSLDNSYRTKMSELRKYYEPCQQVLAVKVFEKWSLLDLLSESDRKIKQLVRKEMFIQEVEKVSSERKLSEFYSYYYNAMMRRIEKANRVVNLEDEAIVVICKIFEANYNQFYDFARGVVEYLNERDLENFVQV